MASNENDSFFEFLKDTAAEVRRWPDWKRTVLTHVPRTASHNRDLEDRMITPEQATAISDARQRAPLTTRSYCETEILRAALSGARYVNIPFFDRERKLEAANLLRADGWGVALGDGGVHVRWGGSSGTGEFGK